MKKIIIFCLVFTFLAVQAPVVLAQTVQADHQVLTVKEEQLIELATQEKFNSLMQVMEKLVQDNLSTVKEEIKLAKINVIDFKYQVEEIMIYYQID
ncbi:hypothetical protein JCM16358_13100 [Halanaerocella petrolearia]